MKVKETMSKEFERPDFALLAEKGDIQLTERRQGLDKIPYSAYTLRCEKYNSIYLLLFSPNPSEDVFYKDLFKKYQSGFKKFMIDFFKVVIGETDFIPSVGYPTDSRIDFKINEESEYGYVTIFAKENGVIPTVPIGYVTFRDIEINKKVAEEIIEYFNGGSADFRGIKFNLEAL